MHLLALSWDVDRPGWLDPAVLARARALTGLGATCEVVALGTGPTSTRTLDGVTVTWVGEAPPVLPPEPEYDVARVLAVATRASAAAERRARTTRPDAVIAIGWQTAWTATTLRSTRSTPLVALLDSTAPGRAGGELDAAGRHAAQVEWWLTYEARRVVAPTERVARDLRRAYRLPVAEVEVVRPAAVLPEPPPDRTGVVVLGPDPFVRAVRRAVAPTPCRTDRESVDGAAVVVVLDDDVDAVVRALAAGSAVVVTDDGPLRELVHARRSGVRVPDDVAAVVEAVRGLLDDPRRRVRLGRAARERVAERHDPHVTAGRLLAVVEAAVEDEAALLDATTPGDPPLRPLLLRSPMLGLVGDD